MIRYKVTTLDDYSILINAHFLRLHYGKGSVVVAKNGTPGVLVFKTRERAEEFGSRFTKGNNYKVKRVKPIGRALKLKVNNIPYGMLNTRRFSGFKIRSFKAYIQRLINYSWNSCWPQGTLAYRSVEVLD